MSDMMMQSESSSLRPGYGSYQDMPGRVDEPVHPFKTLHLFLRGRYWILVLMSVVLTPLGAWVGFKFGVKEYSVSGIIHIVPVKPKILYDTGGGVIPMFAEFMNSESQRIRSQRVIDKALGDVRWKQWRPAFPDRFSETMVEELKSSTNGELLYVQMSDPDPKVAQLGVQTITQAYSDIFTDTATTAERDMDSKLDNVVEQTQSDVANDQTAIIALAKMNPYQTDDLEPVYDGVLKQLQQLGDAIQHKKMYSTNVQAGGGTGAGAAGLPVGEDLLQAIASIPNAQMASALGVRDAYQDRLDKLNFDNTYGPNSTVMKDTIAGLALAKEKVEKVKNIFLHQRDQALAAQTLAGAGAAPAATTQPTVVDANGMPTTMPSADLNSLQAQYDARKQELAEIGKDRILIVEQKEKLTQDELKLKVAQDRRQELAVERPMADRIEVWSDGTLPTKPSSDTHLAIAALGGFTGLFVSAMTVALLGFTNRRFHGPEDTQFSSVRCPMLGMLPTLSSELGDPEQAAMAAHFVHGIRAMLQIKGAGLGGGRVIAITSPSAHNGKTSLSLALGVSFAGAHSKTLLIDCDFIGRALSSRTKAVARPRLGRVLKHQGLIDDEKLQEGLDEAVRKGNRLGEALMDMGYIDQAKIDAALEAQKTHSFGVLEAIDGEDLAECVAPTAIPGLSILPLGQASAEHIGSLSPQMLQQVLDTTRQQYDVVIVDTGPILGSLEASMVATQADDVVLVLANGQDRTAAERSLRYLEMVGAKVAGFVFNRATPRDFIHSKSQSRFSGSADRFRHAKAWSGPQKLAHFGPVAAAVARSVTEPGPTNGKAAQPVGNGEKNGDSGNGGNGHNA